MKRRFRRALAIDPRSLGLFRICFGLTLIGDLLQQAAILGEMTTDAGSLPRSLHHELFPTVDRWSLHLWSGAWEFQAFLYALTFAAAAAFIVGYRTRWATLALWLLLTSLHNRHPLFGTASDSLRRLLLFWGFFLPLAGRFSLDRRAGRDRTPAQPIFSVASAAILLQVLFVYLGAGLAKDYETWVRKGSATILALRLDTFATRLGRALLGYPALLRATSVYTWWVECVMPFVALSPFYNSWARLLAITAFVALHAGLGLCMVLGFFPLLMMAAWLLYLPPRFWTWLEALPERPGLVGRLGARVGALVAAWSGDPGEEADEGERRESWVDGTVSQVILAGAFVLVVLWNVQVLGAKVQPGFPQLVRQEGMIQVMRTLKLTQSWEVFSPHPPSRDGWLMVVASLRDGSQVDLFRQGRPVDWTKPEHVGDLYTSTRWTKYQDNLVSRAGRPHRPAYAAMHVRRWNEGKPASRRVAHVQLIRRAEPTLPDLSEGPLETDVLWQGDFE